MGYLTDWQHVESKAPCPKCGVIGQVERRYWESPCGGHEDNHYRCDDCKKEWWKEGSDA